MKKRIIFAAVVAFSAAFFVSCDKSSVSPTPSPTPTPTPAKSTSVRIDAEAAGDIFEMIDFTGSKFEFDGQTIDLSDLNVDKTFTVTKAAKGSLTIVAKRKESFTPVEGRTYDACALAEVAFNGFPGCTKVISFKGFSFDREKTKEHPRTVAQIVDRWCNKLSANYTFAIDADGNISDSGR